MAVILVKFHQDIGGSLVVEQPIEELRFVKVKILIQLRYIGRMKGGQFLTRRLFVAPVDDVAEEVKIFWCIFFH